MKVDNNIDKLLEALIDYYKSSTFNHDQRTVEVARLYEALLESEVQLKNGEVVPLDDALIDKIVADAS